MDTRNTTGVFEIKITQLHEFPGIISKWSMLHNTPHSKQVLEKLIATGIVGELLRVSRELTNTEFTIDVVVW